MSSLQLYTDNRTAVADERKRTGGISMLRKLASLLFEEEEEIIEEEAETEAVPLELPPIKKAVERPTRAMEVTIESPKKAPEVTVIESIPAPTKPTIRIDVDEKQELRPMKSIVVANKTVVYEFTPVISPIFGVSAKDQKSVPTTVTVKQPIVRHSTLQTIISPIYGVTESVHEGNALKDAEHLQQPLSSDVNRISLDDMLHPVKKEETNETKQFSLFEHADTDTE